MRNKKPLTKRMLKHMHVGYVDMPDSYSNADGTTNVDKFIKGILSSKLEIENGNHSSGKKYLNNNNVSEMQNIRIGYCSSISFVGDRLETDEEFKYRVNASERRKELARNKRERELKLYEQLKEKFEKKGKKKSSGSSS